MAAKRKTTTKKAPSKRGLTNLKPPIGSGKKCPVCGRPM